MSARLFLSITKATLRLPAMPCNARDYCGYSVSNRLLAAAHSAASAGW